MKNELKDLALFGAEPAFKDKLHIGCPNIGNRERLRERIDDLLQRRWLTNAGVYVRKFEERIAEMVGVKHCIAICNGTVALEIASKALGLTGEVIVPAFTFVATPHALQWQGITPRFCDVNPDTHNLDPERLEPMITPRTTGIIAVHLWGRACDVVRLTEIARRHNLRLIFDSAHAFGCSYRGRMIGNFGDAEVFSFHATKFINSFEGGAIVTNNDDLAGKVRLMKNFGFTGYDRVEDVGINGKMSEVSAAMGLTSLESMDEFIAVNFRNFRQYRKELAGIQGMRLLSYDEGEKSNYQYVVVEVDEGVAGVSRDQLVAVLHAENVLARRYFFPGCHLMEPYRSSGRYSGQRLPETEKLARSVLTLPTGTAVELADIRTICKIMKLIIAHAGEFRDRFRKWEEAAGSIES